MPKNEELAEEYAEQLIKDIGGDDFNPSNLPKQDETELQAAARRAKITEARADISDMSGLDKAKMFENIKKMALLPKAKKIGACGELAAYAFLFFAEKSATFGTVKIVQAPNTKKKDDYHAFVQLGSGEDILIVDLWMEYATRGWGSVFTPDQHAEAMGDTNAPYDLTKSTVLYPPE
jgi:hypothetical protein